MEAIVEIGPAKIERSQKDRWVSGSLAAEWAQRFPQLFDEDDLALAEGPQGRRGYHFIEWMAAIVMHQRTGYLSLVSKYEFARHRRKQAVVEQLLSPAVRTALRDRAEHGRAQPPDLLMYAADLSDWFFCEVKGPGDRLGPEQVKKFRALAEMTGRPVRLIRLRWAPRGHAPRVGPGSSRHPFSVHGFEVVITLTPDPAQDAVHWEVTLPATDGAEPEVICSSERFSFLNRGEPQALRAARIHATKILRDRVRAGPSAGSGGGPAGGGSPAGRARS
jgi:hypothetical protein